MIKTKNVSHLEFLIQATEIPKTTLEGFQIKL